MKNSNNRKTKRLLAYILPFILIAFCASCNDRLDTIAIEFENVGQFESAQGEKQEEKHPSMIVLRESNNLAKVEEFVSSTTFESLNHLDFSTHFVLIVFQGFKPTSGYGVEIKDVHTVVEEINIVVELLERDPEKGATETITAPYQIISIPKGELLESDYLLNVVHNNEIILSEKLSFN